MRTIPLDHLAAYPAFLAQASTTEGLLLKNPLSDLGTLRRLDRFTAEHRATLSSGILADLAKWDAPAAATEGARALAGDDAYAVVTGQQAGMAGGPLYTLYKAIGAVRAAAELAGLHPGHRFVPVFWIEADDHDFDEVRPVAILDRAGIHAAFAYDDGDSRPLHVGDRPVNADAIAALTAALREALPPTEFTDQALDLLTGSYRGGDGAETLADGFARTLYAVLGDTPLVVLSSRNGAVKRLAADVMARELADPSLLFGAVEGRTAELAGQGFPTPIVPKPGSLFITHEGERRSLEIAENGGYAIKGTDVRLGAAEIMELVHSAPERFSPKVSLRPLVQDAALPTVLYLGGPSEIAYLNQLRTAYAAFDLEAPAVAERPFALLLEPKARRVLDAAGIALETLMAERFDAGELLVDKDAERELEQARDLALSGIASAYAELAGITKRIDSTLEKTLGAAAANAAKGAEDLAKRLGSALKKKQATEIERLNAVRTAIMPAGKLQERSLGMLYFVDKYGLERVRAVLDAVGLCPGEMQVVEM